MEGKIKMNDLFGVVEKQASKFGLDPLVVGAIIKQESAWEPWAMRYESQWSYFWFIRESAEQILISAATEKQLQMFSYGLGQVMGSVARELGFNDHLPKLCVPEINVFYMCMKLKKLLDKYGDEEDMIASYNMGSPRKTKGGLYENQKNYVDPICATLRQYRALK